MHELSSAKINKIAKNERLPKWVRQAALDELRTRTIQKQENDRAIERALGALALVLVCIFHVVVWL